MHCKRSLHHSWTPLRPLDLIGRQMARCLMHKDAAGNVLHNNYTVAEIANKSPRFSRSSCLVTVTLCSPIVYSARERKFPYFDLKCSFVSLPGGQNPNPSLSLVGYWTLTTLFPRFNPFLLASDLPCAETTNLPVVENN